MRISGSTVLLTGATGGIGQAIAKAVADRGGRLIVTGRRGDMLEQLAADYGARVLVVDLAVPDEVECLAQEAGEVDILIANAGLPASGTLESFTVGEIDRALDVNLRAPMVLAKELAPRMVARGRGHLLFVSSLLGKAASQNAAVYCATKFGLRGFAGGLRADLHQAASACPLCSPGSSVTRGWSLTRRWNCRQESVPVRPTTLRVASSLRSSENRGEVDVAPLSMRLLSVVAGFAPELAAGITRRVGADKVSAKLADGQRDKR